MSPSPSASYSITVRIKIRDAPGALARVLTAIGDSGGNAGTIDLVETSGRVTTRDITVSARDEPHTAEIVSVVAALEHVELLDVADRTFSMHRGGKIMVVGKLPLRSRDDLSMAYTPGVARVCEAIAADPQRSFDLTIRENTVAVVSDGSAVLGLGDIGPAAALPVMEGKALLFKSFGDVDAFPICLDARDPDEIVAIVKALAPTFGGINLEDISAPRCFDIEDRLREELEIPVFHDDQHGTAVVVMAALLNSIAVTGHRLENLRVVVNGVGAAGIACTKILLAAGVGNVIAVDSTGIVHPGRGDMNPSKEWCASVTNAEGVRGGLAEAVVGAHLFLGVSQPGVLTRDLIDTMAPDPIIFAMANPVPEIMPEDVGDRVAVMATGRSDYPNQINNVLCFPGIFKGALACRAGEINEEMKLAAARAIASAIPPEEVAPENIVPSVFDPRVAPAVASAVVEAATRTGVARRSPTANYFSEVVVAPA